MAQVDAVLKLFRIQSSRLLYAPSFCGTDGDGRAGLLEISCLLVNTAAISSSVTEDSKRHWQLLIKLHVVYEQSGVALSYGLYA